MVQGGFGNSRAGSEFANGGGIVAWRMNARAVLNDEIERAENAPDEPSVLSESVTNVRSVSWTIIALGVAIGLLNNMGEAFHPHRAGRVHL